MKVISKKLFALAAVCASTVLSAQAQTLVDTWSYLGGGLSPATYGGVYRPASLDPDAASDSGASIAVSGWTSGGLGSSGFPEGYGGIYTLFSASTVFTIQTTNVLTNVETISVSFLSGGGTSYDENSLLLNYNIGNVGLAQTSFLAVDEGIVDTPIGDTEVTRYTWTWDVSGLGPSTGFSVVNWTSGVHTFFNEISMTQTQAVPEPSTYALVGMGFGIALVLRMRSRKHSNLSA